MGVVVEISLDEQGRIIFPEAVRNKLGLQLGMTFVVAPEKSGGVRLEPQVDQPLLIDENGILVVAVKVMEDITDIVNRDREERIRHLMGLEYETGESQ